MKTGALYVRVSTDDQVEYSPDAQIRLGLEYAKKNNIIIPKQFIFQEVKRNVSKNQIKKIRC